MNSLRRIKSTLARLHRNEQGAEGLEKLLIVAAIVLPLLAVLLFFRSDITEWVNDKWDEVKGDAQQDG
ncbi:MAG: hypothetical protein AAGI68_00660 [Planctomycetota bacterium]